MEDYKKEKYKDGKYVDGNIDKETMFRPFQDEVVEEKETEKIRFVEKQAVPKLDGEEFESIEKPETEVTGNLFDRVRFLGERIEETKKEIELREGIHNDIIADIDSDIEEKNRIESQLTSMDDKRNIKMDISILRREKRNENVRFWKDRFELRTELRELLENHQTESKIVSIFEDMGGEE
jgi:hypothetical protein